MLKQVKPYFVKRNLTSCLTLIGTKVCIAGFAGTKYYGPHPSTWAIEIIGAPSAWRAQGPKHVKTALLVRRFWHAWLHACLQFV